VAAKIAKYAILKSLFVVLTHIDLLLWFNLDNIYHQS